MSPKISLLFLIIQIIIVTSQTHNERSFLNSMKPFKLHFTQNNFNFRMLAANNKTKLPIVIGQLEIKQSEQTRRFLKRNKLNLTVEATRDQNSLNLFQLNTKTLEIQLINREYLIGSQHFLRVHLFDMYKRYVATWCTVQIDIMNNVNKNPPVFNKAFYEAQIVENNAPNTLVVKVSFYLKKTVFYCSLKD